MEEEIDVSKFTMSEDKTCSIKCVMNMNKILKKDITFSTCSCLLCPELKENICMECLETCHKGHNGDNKVFAESTSKIFESFCSCAENGHIVKKIAQDSDAIQIKKDDIKCSLNDVLYHSNVDYFYMDPITQSYYCMYCYLNCIDKKSGENKEYVLKERSKFSFGPPPCICSNKKNHSTPTANLNCLHSIIIDKSFESYLNYTQIPGNIISKQVLSERYLQPFIEANKSIGEAYRIHKINEDIASKYITDLYLGSAKLLRSFKTIFGKDNIMIDSPSICKAFDFNMLNLIFPSEDTTDSCLIEVKLNILYCFRVFYLRPIMKTFKQYNVSSECENSNPFHRLMIKKDIRELFDITGIDKKKFFYFFTRFYNSIFDYNRACDIQLFMSYAIEFLDWCIFLATFRYSQEEDVTNIYQDILIANFTKVIDTLRSKRKMQLEVKKKIERFIKLTVININDEIFYREIYCKIEKEKKQLLEEDKMARFELKTMTKLISSKNFLSNVSSAERFIELEEEQPVVAPPIHQEIDGYNRDSSYKDFDFAFEKGNIQKSLLKTLFAYKNESKEERDKGLHWEIYDWLINEEDYYIENIQSLANANQSYPYTIKEMFIPYGFINPIHYFTTLSEYESIIKDFDMIDALQRQYYISKIEEAQFFGQLQMLLPEIKRKLTGLFETHQHQTNNKLFMQMILFKKGCFDPLYLIYQLIGTNINIQKRLTGEMIELIYQELFAIFDLLTRDNLLLSTIFFTKESVKLFFANINEDSKPRMIKLNFYLSSLRQFISNDYKLTLKLFVENIIKTYNSIQESRDTQKDIIDPLSLQEIKLTLKILIKSLTISNSKTNLMMNSDIANLITSIFQSNLYMTIWNRYIKSYEDQLIETYKISNDELHFILTFFKLVNGIDDYYFYMLEKKIPIDQLKDLLEKNINEMSLKDRRILSMTYAKFYVITPFNLLPVLTVEDMNLMIDQADNNLNGKPIRAKEVVIKKKVVTKKKETKSQGGMASFLKKQSKEVSPIKPIVSPMKFKDSSSPSPNPQNQIQTQEFNSPLLIKSKEPSPLKEKGLKGMFTGNVSGGGGGLGGASLIILQELGIDEQSLGMEPVFTNLIKYRRHMKLYLQSYFKNKPKMFIKYFTDVVLVPSTYSVYKILYFSPILSVKFKYLAYKMVYLFLECYKYFIETIILDPIKLWNNEDFKKEVNDFFIIPPDNPNIFDLLKGIKERLSCDVPKMAKDPKFEPLKTKILLDYFFRYINHIKILDFLHSNDAEDNQGYDPNQMLMMNNNVLMLGQRPPSERGNEGDENDLKKKINDFVEFYQEKKSAIDDNIVIDMFNTPTEEDDIKTADFKKIVILDLLYRLNFGKESILPSGNEEKYMLINAINKIFKADPDLWHDIMADIAVHTKEIINEIVTKHLPYLLQLLYIDYHKLRKVDLKHVKDTKSVEYFLILIEYLRLHCENHHKIFQTILTTFNISKGNNKTEDLDFLNFIIKIPVLSMNNVLYYESKRELAGRFKPANKTFFNTLLIGVTDYLIEIIQGSFEFNMKRFNLTGDSNETAVETFLKFKRAEKKDTINKDFEAYIDIGYLCFDNLENEQSEFFLSQFFRFIICFFEESLNPKINKEEIVKKFNPKKIIQGLVHSTTNLYLHYSGHSHDNKLALPENFSEEISNYYLGEADIQENPYFVLSSNIFRFLKITEQWKCGDKIAQQLNDIKTECEENPPINEKNRNFIIGRRESYRFFSKVIREVEIFYRPKDSLSELERKKYRDFFNNSHEFEKLEEEFKKEVTGDVQKVVYLIIPDSLFVTEKDMINFTQSAPLEKNIKLNYLLEYIPNMETDIKMRKLLWEKNSKVLTMLYSVNYQYANYISIFLAVIVNILILLSSFYKITIHNPNEFNFSFEKPFGEETDGEIDINKLIITKQRFEFNSLFILIVGFIHLLFVICALLNWFYFSIIRIGLFREGNKDKGHKKSFLAMVLELLYNSECFPLYWNFLTGIIAILSIKFHFLFSLQLFTVFTLFETMQTVIYSVRIKYRQFLSAGLLMIIFSLFFALVKFQWFAAESENEDCVTFLRCFLSIMTNGIRGGGGMGFPMKKNEEAHYYPEFLFEWVFYFSLILILLNVINGIIVDTFQALREQANEEYEAKMNMCFICSLKRSIFERKGIDFENHKEKEHNVLNYFHYISKVLFTDDQNLNSLDYQVLLTVRQLRTDFFPIKTCVAFAELLEAEKEKEKKK